MLNKWQVNPLLKGDLVAQRQYDVVQNIAEHPSFFFAPQGVVALLTTSWVLILSWAFKYCNASLALC